jgi:hypothetical protein
MAVSQQLHGQRAVLAQGVQVADGLVKRLQQQQQERQSVNSADQHTTLMHHLMASSNA